MSNSKAALKLFYGNAAFAISFKDGIRRLTVNHNGIGVQLSDNIIKPLFERLALLQKLNASVRTDRNCASV